MWMHLMWMFLHNYGISGKPDLLFCFCRCLYHNLYQVVLHFVYKHTTNRKIFCIEPSCGHFVCVPLRRRQDLLFYFSFDSFLNQAQENYKTRI